MSSAVSEEGADSTSTTTAEPEEKGSTTVEEKKTVESDADQPESAGKVENPPYYSFTL